MPARRRSPPYPFRSIFLVRNVNIPGPAIRPILAVKNIGTDGDGHGSFSRRPGHGASRPVQGVAWHERQHHPADHHGGRRRRDGGRHPCRHRQHPCQRQRQQRPDAHRCVRQRHRRYRRHHDPGHVRDARDPAERVLHLHPQQHLHPRPLAAERPDLAGPVHLRRNRRADLHPDRHADGPEPDQAVRGVQRRKLGRVRHRPPR